MLPIFLWLPIISTTDRASLSPAGPEALKEMAWVDDTSLIIAVLCFRPYKHWCAPVCRKGPPGDTRYSEPAWPG